MVPQPVEVKALKNFRIWLRYDDGTEGSSTSRGSSTSTRSTNRC